MTKVFIIELNLGSTVEDIINNEVEVVTGESKRIVEAAIEHQKNIKAAREAVKAAKNKSATEATRVLEDSYQKLVEAGIDGLPCDELVENCKPIIPNSSAFTLRMKNYLKSKDNPYTLNRKTKAKIARYYFKPFNEDLDSE